MKPDRYPSFPLRNWWRGTGGRSRDLASDEYQTLDQNQAEFHGSCESDEASYSDKTQSVRASANLYPQSPAERRIQIQVISNTDKVSMRDATVYSAGRDITFIKHSSADQEAVGHSREFTRDNSGKFIQF